MKPYSNKNISLAQVVYAYACSYPCILYLCIYSFYTQAILRAEYCIQISLTEIRSMYCLPALNLTPLRSLMYLSQARAFSGSLTYIYRLQ